MTVEFVIAGYSSIKKINIRFFMLVIVLEIAVALALKFIGEIFNASAEQILKDYFRAEIEDGYISRLEPHDITIYQIFFGSNTKSVLLKFFLVLIRNILLFYYAYILMQQLFSTDVNTVGVEFYLTPIYQKSYMRYSC